MARITVNGNPVETSEGMTLLEAARATGVDIPTLCYMKKLGPQASCMLCVVKDCRSGRLVPSCATPATDGMAIDTGCDEVRAARRDVLRMLLSEHLGDCRGPCSRICPASFNIPLMLRHIVRNDMDAAVRVARCELVMPATLGRVCHAPCEGGCRRKDYDRAVSIRATHGELAEKAMAQGAPAEAMPEATGKRIAIVGAGMAGLAAAATGVRFGHACRVYEKAPCSAPRLRERYESELPAAVLDAEVESIRALGVEFVYRKEVGASVSIDTLLADHDAVLVACDLPHTASDRVFDAGEELEVPIRSVAHGKTAMRRAHAHLCGEVWDERPRRYQSRIMRLHAHDHPAYAAHRLQNSATASENDVPATEAARCLHCDCLAPKSCKLRQYAEEYGLSRHTKREMPAPPVEAIQADGGILYEAGKCVKCGLCVALSRLGSGVGLAFGGRGLASRVQPPFGVSLGEALGDAAGECVRACPTGALAFAEEEEFS